MEQERRNPNPKQSFVSESEKEDTRSNSSDNPGVPNDVLEDILKKLPPKSVARFKSVSEEWRSIIQSRSFVKLHTMNQKSGTPKFLTESVSGTGEVSLVTLSLEPDDTQKHCSYTFEEYFQPPLQVSRSCDGLICVRDQKSVYVVNPTMRELRELPPSNYDPNSSEFSRSWVGFGRDNVTGTYKVVLVYAELALANQVQDQEERVDVLKCEVFALDTDSWRQVNPPPNWNVSFNRNPIHVNGSLFCLGPHQLDANQKVLAFDLHTEKFHTEPHVSFCDENTAGILVCNVKNRMCLTRYRRDAVLEVWCLGANKRWEKMETIDRFYMRNRAEDSGERKGSATAAEFVRKMIPLPPNCVWMIRKYPGILTVISVGLVSYFESLVSVYQ